MNHLMEFQEQQLATLARRTLDASCRELPEGVAQALARARQEALTHQKVAVGRLSFAGIGNLTTDGLVGPVRTALALVALVTGMAVSYYWNGYLNTQDYVDVDSALLTDELPVDAYTDQGFRAWLEHSDAAPSE